MNRINQKFDELRKKRKKAFVAYVTAGDPDLKTTAQLVLELEKSGADIIELGVPFSDPQADGPTIQAASQRALKKGVTLTKILSMVRSLRRQTDIPIALMTYYNPVFHMGDQNFVQKAVSSGVDGVMIPDLPPEEAAILIKTAKAENFSTIFFISPTTTLQRMKRIVQHSTGFIYYVSLAGVTGARTALPTTLLPLKQARKISKIPVCVGFGISTRAQVLEMKKHADGVIVGSAIVKEIDSRKGQAGLVKNVGKFVKKLTT